MDQLRASELVDGAWQFPLFEALYGRRSRRFGVGFEINEGPFPYHSQGRSLPLSELEEALLVAAGVGVSGTPLWDMARPVASAAGLGRTFGSTSGGRRTALFLTNDEGVHVMDPLASATKVRQVETREERANIVAFYRERRKTLRAGRLQNEVGRFVAGHGGGMNVVDDRHGFRPAANERWVRSGLVDRDKALPLSILERQACYFMWSEPAIICHNIFLATEAVGLGGWMHCGFLSEGVLHALGFEVVRPTVPGSLANPVGIRGSFEAYCPPFFGSMD